MKVKMFGFLKNLLRRPGYTPADGEESVAAETSSLAEATAAPARGFGAARRNLVHQQGHQASGQGIELPLQGILNELPLELQPRVQQHEVGALMITVPLEKILAQLSRGSVKISFGELRRAAPGVFSPEEDRDRVLVPLPLADVLARLNPALITCRRAQRRVEVPDEISSPFDANGQGLVFSIGPAKPGPAASPPQPEMPAPSLRPAGPMRVPLVVPVRATVPAAHPAPPAPSLAPVEMSQAAPPTPAFAPVKLRVSPAVREPSPTRPAAAPAPAAIPQAPAPQPVSEVQEPEPLIFGLTALAEGWPEAVRKEVVDLNLVDAKVALPNEAVEGALKLGRIAFSWKTLRSWIRPSPLPTVSAHDGMVLELPLKVVAPRFLTRQKEASKAQQKVAIDEDIPNLFFGFPQGEGAAAVAAATARPADTNYYVWDDTSDVVRDRDEVQRSSSAGTKFAVKYATPNEIVSRAAALDGVAGALIALPDGLMVANRLPPDLNADTLAAFLPQIFGKVSQCTKELRMGELNNLNFTVGNVPWKIFRVNAIFFAVFGRTGQPLPTAQVLSLAAELDHKPK